jgi:hypothetical protein
MRDSLSECVVLSDRLCRLVVEFLATNPEVPGSILDTGKRGPLSLVRITEELHKWKSSGSGVRNRD